MTEFASTLRPQPTKTPQIARHNRDQALIACDLLDLDKGLRADARELVLSAISYFGLAGFAYERAFEEATAAVQERLNRENPSPRTERMIAFAREKFFAMMSEAYRLVEVKRHTALITS
jgi:hypothetical protein